MFFFCEAVLFLSLYCFYFKQARVVAKQKSLPARLQSALRTGTLYMWTIASLTRCIWSKHQTLAFLFLLHRSIITHRCVSQTANVHTATSVPGSTSNSVAIHCSSDFFYVCVWFMRLHFLIIRPFSFIADFSSVLCSSIGRCVSLPWLPYWQISSLLDCC